jgi:hypothetical protein
MAVKESQKVKATCWMYTVGKGPIRVKDAKKAVAERVSQQKPKKAVETEFVINFEDDEGDIDEDDDDVLHLEL